MTSLHDDYSGPFDPTLGLRDLSRRALAPLGREYLLHGHLQDRVGIPLDPNYSAKGRSSSDFVGVVSVGCLSGTFRRYGTAGRGRSTCGAGRFIPPVHGAGCRSLCAQLDASQLAA